MNIIGNTIDPNESGLIACYDMVPNYDDLVDKTGNGNDGTITDGASFEKLISKGLRFNTSYVDLGNNSSFKIDTFTVSMWIISNAPITSTKGLLSWGAAHWYVGLGSNQRLLFSSAIATGTPYALYSANNSIWPYLLNNIVFSVYTNNPNVRRRIYLNGNILVDDLSSDGWFASYGTKIIIGGFSTSSDALKFNGNIGSLKIFRNEQSKSWVSSEYCRLRRYCFYIKNFENISSTTGGNIGETPLRVNSGTFTGTAPNTIICSDAGTIYLPGGFISESYNQNAYGRWHIDVIKQSGHTTKIGFIGSGKTAEVNGTYSVDISSDGTVSLVEYGVGTLFATSAGVAPLGELFGIDILRKYNGEFTIKINGVVISAVSGSNPVVDNTITSCTTISINAGSGDEFSNLKKYHLP